MGIFNQIAKLKQDMKSKAMSMKEETVIVKKNELKKLQKERAKLQEMKSLDDSIKSEKKNISNLKHPFWSKTISKMREGADERRKKLKARQDALFPKKKMDW